MQSWFLEPFSFRTSPIILNTCPFRPLSRIFNQYSFLWEVRKIWIPLCTDCVLLVFFISRYHPKRNEMSRCSFLYDQERMKSPSPYTNVGLIHLELFLDMTPSSSSPANNATTCVAWDIFVEDENSLSSSLTCRREQNSRHWLPFLDVPEFSEASITAFD